MIPILPILGGAIGWLVWREIQRDRLAPAPEAPPATPAPPAAPTEPAVTKEELAARDRDFERLQSLVVEGFAKVGEALAVEEEEIEDDLLEDEHEEDLLEAEPENEGEAQ